MTRLRSFRSRLLMGTLLWTAGLLGLAHLLSMGLMHHFPWVMKTPRNVMLVMGLALTVAGLALVRGSIAQFDRLRDRLIDVRDGRAQRVEGTYPTEVQPLVGDLNGLLDHREALVRRALAKAGDLAHGLKTPLAVLSREAELAEAAGHRELAATIAHQVQRMRRQVDYHLAQARAAGSGAAPGARCAVLVSAEGLSRTLLRLHAERGLDIEVAVDSEHHVRGEREDLDEMLGNLLDNACKWARSRVVVGSSRDGSFVVIAVEDDGPGIDPSMRDRVLHRGVRADEVAPGSGLGLAIVRDLAELYGGAISLDASPLGGVCARLRLPAG